MNIAAINLPYDNNYGGNLQRFAMIKTLQKLGHEAPLVDLRFNLRPNLLCLAPRVIKRILWRIFGSHNAILPEWRNYKNYIKLIESTKPFYDKYIPHTYSVKRLGDFKDYNKFDIILTGSDQVWRKNIAHGHLYNLFMDFLPDNPNQKRIAYGVSLGTDKNELTDSDIAYLSKYYKKFDAVSVREASALDLFEKDGWTSPKASLVLDPTLLLTADEYISLMPKEANHIELFCYILDNNDAKQAFLHRQSTEQRFTATLSGIDGYSNLSVGQWLSNFYNATSVITDSFHGMVFSIIFHKPFIVIGNEMRGIERFTNLLSALGLSDRLVKKQDLDRQQNFRDIDWYNVDHKLSNLTNDSIAFLTENIK